MTVEQILTEIYRSGCADEVFLALAKRVIIEKKELNNQQDSICSTCIRTDCAHRFMCGYYCGSDKK